MILYSELLKDLVLMSDSLENLFVSRREKGEERRLCIHNHKSEHMILSDLIFS